MEYAGPSPDEISLVEAAAGYGYVLDGRSTKDLKVTIRGQKQSYKVLNIAKVTSKRARMTVVVRHPDGKIVVYSKGADSVMAKLLKSGESKKLIKATQGHLDKFSRSVRFFPCLLVY
jgi:magnesium-transporting ATPase (P-type)